jgi:phosphatidate cytidylyltransferase
MKRVLTALILAPLIVYVAGWGPGLVFLAVLTAIALLCHHEYAGIVAAYGIRRPGPVTYVAGLIVLLTPVDPALAITVIALVLLGLGVAREDFRTTLPEAGAALLGVMYIFGSWRWAIFLRQRSPYWLLFALALSWVGDIAAFYIGKNFGRHKLAPRVSPGKSWEGALASLAGSMLFGFFYLKYLIPQVAPWQGLLLAGVGNIVGQVGDLAESVLKRGAGVKDSGNMLPGHGGWLDRVDSTLFALPVIFWLVMLLAL